MDISRSCHISAPGKISTKLISFIPSSHPPSLFRPTKKKKKFNIGARWQNGVIEEWLNNFNVKTT